MVFREVGPDFSFDDNSRPIAGKDGEVALQSNEKLVTRTGAPQAVADIDVDSVDLAAGDYETDTLDIGGTSGIAIFIESENGNSFEAVLELRDGDGTVLGQIDDTVFADLSGSSVNIVIPVFSDRVKIYLRDTSGASQNVVSGSGNANIGTPSQLNAQIQGGSVGVEGVSGNIFQDQALNTDVPDTSTSLVTYLARALNSQGLDEFVSRVTDPAGTQVDPRGVIEPTGTQVDPRSVADSGGTVVDPAEASDYPNTVAQQDLIGTGDLTIGPVSVAKTEAILVSANSEEGNSWSASVTWQDANGNVFQTESATDIGLSSVVDDWARLVRKGPQVSITFTDTSAATANNLNAFVDSHE